MVSQHKVKTWPLSLTVQQSDNLDNKVDFEATQIAAVHDQERQAEDDERAQKSWLYRVWVSLWHITLV